MIGTVLRKLSEALTQSWRYAKHPATVVLQYADDTVDIRPDDQSLLGNGISSVTIRHGLPGVRVRVLQGARVLFGFESGDLSKPYVSLWDPAAIDQLILGAASQDGGSGQAVARVGDVVRTTWPTLNIAGSLVIPPSPTAMALTATIVVANPTAGVIVSGSQSVLA